MDFSELQEEHTGEVGLKKSLEGLIIVKVSWIYRYLKITNSVARNKYLAYQHPHRSGWLWSHDLKSVHNAVCIAITTSDCASK